MPGVSSTHPTYDLLKDQWRRCRDTTDGTDAVKAGRVRYLPALDSHLTKPLKYNEYLLRALYYNAMGRTVQGLSGAIFQKAPNVSNHGAAEQDIKDITLTGQPLEMFALQTTKEYLTTGRYGILVDMSTELAVTPRPYWVGYQAEDIVNWRFEKMGGDQELSLVVLREPEEIIKSDDEFVSKPDIQFRVLRLTNGVYTQQVYTPKQGTDYKREYVAGPILVPTRRGRALNFIPFSLPWSIGSPPLVDLADVNLSHYRGSADLKHGLHFTALPTPWVSGQKGNDGGKPLAIGSGTAWVLDVNGKAGMLEFTGHGLASIQADLTNMEKMMATLGARVLEVAPHYAETALSVSMRHSSDYASLRTVAQVVEQQISWALKVHCWWCGTENLVADDPADVQLNKVFFDQSVSADELRALLLALQGSTISYQTFYTRLANTGWTREGIDAEAEKLDIQKDGEQFKVVAKGNLPPDAGPKPLPGAVK